MLTGFAVRGQFIEQSPVLSGLARLLDRNAEPYSSEAYLQASSTFKELSWQHEYEADEVRRRRLAPLAPPSSCISNQGGKAKYNMPKGYLQNCPAPCRWPAPCWRGCACRRSTWRLA